MNEEIIEKKVAYIKKQAAAHKYGWITVALELISYYKEDGYTLSYTISLLKEKHDIDINYRTILTEIGRRKKKGKTPLVSGENNILTNTSVKASIEQNQDSDIIETLFNGEDPLKIITRKAEEISKEKNDTANQDFIKKFMKK